MSNDATDTSAAEPLHYLKIFGERNSGTNYLARLCNANLIVQLLRGDAGVLWELGQRRATLLPGKDRGPYRREMHDAEIARILHSDFGWKHAAPPLDVIRRQPHAAHTFFVVLTKHPYSWAESLLRRPYNFRAVPRTFSEFIRAPIEITAADNLPADPPLNPLQMLRAKLLAYRELMRSELPTIHIRYESLLLDVPGHLELLASYVQRRSDTLKDIETDVKHSGRTREDFLRQYDVARAGAELSREDRAFIAEQVGGEVFEFLGYKP